MADCSGGTLKALRRELDNRSLKIVWERHKKRHKKEVGGAAAAVLGAKGEPEARTQRLAGQGCGVSKGRLIKGRGGLEGCSH